jgi:hypothetical protein
LGITAIGETRKVGNGGVGKGPAILPSFAILDFAGKLWYSAVVHGLEFGFKLKYSGPR